MKETTRTKKIKIQKQGMIFNPKNGSIIKQSGEEIFLEHRLKDFFTILFDNKNDVVTREELMSFVWKDVVVNEESVTKAASDLRKFFKSNDIFGFSLITIHKHGYKLEVAEFDLSNKSKANFFILPLKIIGYIFFALLLLIIIVRAINY